jgi:hypothetical protein
LAEGKVGGRKKKMFIYRTLRLGLAVGSLFTVVSCGIVDQTAKKAGPSNHIITPAHYYTTAKAKNLSDRYKETLERLVVNIVRNQKTAKLQFANNIVSTGGIGFFTHSASRLPDERYLEVVLGVPEVFDETMDFSSKVDRIFSEYGGELLSILCSETAIYKDPDVAGYGLNLSWRNTASGGTGPRITLERSVVYLSKEDASRFLNRQTSKEATLSAATVFAIQGEGRASRIAFAPLQPHQQLAASAPGSNTIDRPSDELTRMPEPQVKEKDLSPKEPAIAPVRQPEKPKAATKSARETIPKAAPSKPDAQKLVKEIDSYPEKKTGRQPAPTTGEESAKQKSAATPSQNNQQVVSLPSQTKAHEKTPTALKSDRASRPETTPERKEKGGEAQALAPRQDSTSTLSRPEKVEGPSVPSRVDSKIVERDQPPGKKAEKQSDSKAPPSDQQVKVFQEKVRPGEPAKEPGEEAGRPSIKTEARRSAEVKTETKAPPAGDRQGTVSQQPSGQLTKEPLKKALPEPVKAEAKAASDLKTEAKPLPQVVEKTPPIRQKIPSEQAGAEPIRKKAQGPNKTEAQSTAKPKAEIKAQPEQPMEMQGMPVSPSQTRRKTEDKISSLDTARENNETLALAKKNPGLDQGAEGYVIQIIFLQKVEAERWSSILNKQGYRVSMSAAGPEETVRLRVGAFPSPVQAKNHLQQLEKQGLKNAVVLQVLQ